jgi:hypothetical protein
MQLPFKIIFFAPCNNMPGQECAEFQTYTSNMDKGQTNFKYFSCGQQHTSLVALHIDT